MTKYLAAIAIVCFMNLLPKISAAQKNAFSDSKTIDSLLTNTDPGSNVKARKTLFNIVLKYLPDGNVAFIDQLKTSFQREIVDALAQHLADTLKNYVAMGESMYRNWGNERTEHSHVNKSTFILIVDSLKNLQNSVKVIEERLVIKNSVNALRDRSKELSDALAANSMIEKIRLDSTITDQGRESQIASILHDIKSADTLSLKILISELAYYQSALIKLPLINKKIEIEGQKIKKIFDENSSYFNRYYKEKSQKSVSVSFQEMIVGGSSAVNQVSNVGNKPIANVRTFSLPSQSDLIDALAIYMVRRFKQDAVLRFLNILKKQVRKQPILLDMFPATLRLLDEYPNFEIPRFGKVWSHAIAEDLMVMPENILNGEYLRSRTGLQNRAMFDIFSDIVRVARLAADRPTFSRLVGQLAESPDKLKSQLVSRSISILRMINTEFVKNGDYLDPENDLSTLSPQRLQIFLALLSYRYPSVFEQFQQKFLYPVNNTSGQIEQFARENILKMDLCINILTVLKTFRSDLINYNKAVKVSVANGQEIRYDGLGFWELQEKIINLVSTTTFKPLPVIGRIQTKDYVRTAGSVIRIYRLAETKNYSAMVHESVTLIDQFSPSTQRYTNLLIKEWKSGQAKYAVILPFVQVQLAKIDSVLNTKTENEPFNVTKKHLDALNFIARQLTGQDTSGLNGLPVNFNEVKTLLAEDDLPNLSSILNRLYISINSKTLGRQLEPNKNNLIYTISKFAEFFTDMMTAQNSKDMADVISTYAASPNSFEIKRSTRASIGLNSYIGAYAGGEYAGNWKGVWGLSAPIGLAFSWGIHKRTKTLNETSFIGRNGGLKDLRGSSLTINVALLDIGAVISYRMNNGEDAALPEKVKFGQFLSPGLSLSYGIKGLPLCITAGGQLTPELRSFGGGMAKTAFRVYGGLFYDLPLLNIYKR